MTNMDFYEIASDAFDNRGFTHEDKDRICRVYDLNSEEGDIVCGLIEDLEQSYCDEYDDYNLEMGFDPYMGCYTNDC